jgi:hypothetical protein
VITINPDSTRDIHAFLIRLSLKKADYTTLLSPSANVLPKSEKRECAPFEGASEQPHLACKGPHTLIGQYRLTMGWAPM